MKRGMILLGILIALTGVHAVGAGSDSLVLRSVPGKTVQFKEIRIEDVPKTVHDAMKEYFADYEINKAFKSDEGSYRLEVSRENIRYVLYYDDKGELIKVDQPESSNSKETP